MKQDRLEAVLPRIAEHGLTQGGRQQLSALTRSTRPASTSWGDGCDCGFISMITSSVSALRAQCQGRSKTPKALISVESNDFAITVTFDSMAEPRVGRGSLRRALASPLKQHEEWLLGLPRRSHPDCRARDWRKAAVGSLTVAVTRFRLAALGSTEVPGAAYAAYPLAVR
jgi:hypothetical protein